MKTGIKTSTPATISPSFSLKNTLFFAINQPRVEIVAKTTEYPVSFSVFGNKEYKNGFINTALEYIYSLEIFKLAEPVHLEINNKIPFGHGFGAHTSFFACLLKAMCAINKISFNNRELYNYLLALDASKLQYINPGQLLTCLDGGCFFVDEAKPELYHRIYLPSGLSFIIFNEVNRNKENHISLPYNKNSSTKSIEFVLGLHTSNWEFIKQGFIDTASTLTRLNLPQQVVDVLIENMLGLDYNIDNAIYFICCNNSLMAETCYNIFQKGLHAKEKHYKHLILSTIDLSGTIKM